MLEFVVWKKVWNFTYKNFIILILDLLPFISSPIHSSIKKNNTKAIQILNVSSTELTILNNTILENSIVLSDQS
jgi:hypothetical protein